jgi:hypothetical protein
VQSGFARAGIHPFDPALILLRSDLIQPTDKPSDKLSRHKGGGISIDGKVLTSETIIQQLRNEAATKPAKGSSFTPSLHQNLLTHWTLKRCACTTTSCTAATNAGSSPMCASKVTFNDGRLLQRRRPPQSTAVLTLISSSRNFLHYGAFFSLSSL